MQTIRRYVIDMDRCMAAARRIKRLERTPAAEAERLQRLLIRAFGRSVIKLYRDRSPVSNNSFATWPTSAPTPLDRPNASPPLSPLMSWRALQRPAQRFLQNCRMAINRFAFA